MLNKIWCSIPYFFYVLVIVLAFLGLSAKYSLPGDYRIYSVMSGSMGPKIPTGSLVLVQKQPVYKVGEAISFLLPKTETIVTHRIVETDIESTASGQVGKFKTKGDANDAPDNEPVLKDNIIGKVIASVPLLGYPVSFTKTLPGLVLLIVIPATLIIYTELLTIKTEIKKLVARVRPAKSNEGKITFVDETQDANQIRKQVNTKAKSKGKSKT